MNKEGFELSMKDVRWLLDEKNYGWDGSCNTVVNGERKKFAPVDIEDLMKHDVTLNIDSQEINCRIYVAPATFQILAEMGEIDSRYEVIKDLSWDWIPRMLRSGGLVYAAYLKEASENRKEMLVQNYWDEKYKAERRLSQIQQETVQGIEECNKSIKIADAYISGHAETAEQKPISQAQERTRG